MAASPTSSLRTIIEANAPITERNQVRPGEMVKVKIERLNPREDLLRVQLPEFPKPQAVNRTEKKRCLYIENRFRVARSGLRVQKIQPTFSWFTGAASE